MKRLIVIGGPTASGKTALSVALAKHYQTVVISADSRQFYKEMSVGTAKPTVEEMDGITHYFIDSHSITDEINAARFASEVTDLVADLFKNVDTLILTGGSGMFIDAFVFGLDNIPHDQEIAKQLNKQLEQEGLASLLTDLEEKDPVYYATVDRNNPMRVIRALEAIRITNQPFSSLRTGSKKEHPFKIEYFVLDLPRDLLYERINLRVDKMVENGLEQEVKNLIPYKNLKPLATVGYTELFRYFDGEIDRATCIDLIKQNSRRYAKRQLTWFKRNQIAQWIPYQKEVSKMVAVIVSKIN